MKQGILLMFRVGGETQTVSPPSPFHITLLQGWVTLNNTCMGFPVLVTEVRVGGVSNLKLTSMYVHCVCVCDPSQQGSRPAASRCLTTEGCQRRRFSNFPSAPVNGNINSRFLVSGLSTRRNSGNLRLRLQRKPGATKGVSRSSGMEEGYVWRRRNMNTLKMENSRQI